MTDEERRGQAKANALLGQESALRRIMLEIYGMAGWSGVIQAVTKIQQEIGADMKSRGRQGEGGWIF